MGLSRPFGVKYPKIQEFSCVTTTTKRSLCGSISFMSVFRGHFALVIYFAKDGKQYICSRLLSIEAMIAKFCCFASYHSRLALSYHGTNYIDSSPHDFDIQLDRHFIDIHAYQVFPFPPLPSLLTLGLYRANLILSSQTEK